MSTRDQILEALSESPDGMTLKEITEFCTACEHDEQIVGRMIGILRRENVIHPASEQRGGATVWIFGKDMGEVQEAHIHISLAGGESRPSSHVSEAARAIANMRGGAERAKGRSRTNADADVTTMQVHARETMREKVRKLLKAHGPMTSRELRSLGVKGADLSKLLTAMAEAKEIVCLGGGPKSRKFGLPTPKDQEANNTQPAKGRDPETLIRKANGGGGAVTPAAGPAIVAAPKPAAQPGPDDNHADLDLSCAAREPEKVGGDNLYKAALLDLQDRRTAVVEQLAKIDRAIEAMWALA